MIAVLISFQAIEIAYSDIVDNAQHVLLSQATQNTFSVVKQGVRIKKFFEHIVNIDQNKMEAEQSNGQSHSLVFVCFSPKNKKITKEVFISLSQKLENKLIYFNIDKAKFCQYSFNRPLFIQNEICFGQGFSQLRTKEQLRIALNSHLKCCNLEYIFIQKNANEIKELKKQGFSNILQQFDSAKFDELYQKAKISLTKGKQLVNQPQLVSQLFQKHPYAKRYLEKVYVTHKEVNVKAINPFETRNLTIKGMINQLFVPSTYYNISPKSWVHNQLSQEIVSYVYHNLSDQQLYLAKTSRPKDLSNQQDFQIKILSYYLTYLINPEALCVPHDKHSTLIKFSKIKAYQNKKAFLNIRPYIEGIQTLSQLKLTPFQYFQLFSKGTLCGRKVKGVAGTLLFSWLINQNLNNKSLSQQTTLLSSFSMDSFNFVTKASLQEHNVELSLCRTDYFNVFNMSNYKVINDFFILNRQEQTIALKFSQISAEVLQEMCNLLFNVQQQTLFMIKNLFIYYRWNTKIIYYYDLFHYRFQAICQLLRPFNQTLSLKTSLLLSYPCLACLLIPQNYDFFLLPPNSEFFPYQSKIEQKFGNQRAQNPYLAYMNKGSSFAIFKVDFPCLSFLQWIKSTSKYQIIEYMSMISKTLEEYVILDKRLKLSSINDKKNVVLVVDHAQLCPEIINKPKGVKTVLIYRLKKPEENQDVATVGSEVQRKDFFDQSQEQLIKVLVYWGQKVIKGVTKLQLFDWVLQSYINIKCAIFNLDVSVANQFLSTVHKAISTNKHRLKQLEQNHRDSCKYLYTYPIFKHNQKVQFNYHVFQFLHVKILFNEILENRWGCKLQTYQNASVNQFRHFMDLKIIQMIVRQLIVFLRQISDRKLDTFQYNSLTGDCLQLARSLTQTNKKQEFAQEIMMLHYEVFVEIIKIKNYNSIEQSTFTGKFVCLVAEQSLEIFSQEKHKSISSSTSQVIALSGHLNSVLMLNFNKSTQLFLIQEFLINQGLQIQLESSFSFAIENIEIVSLLREKKSKKILIHRISSQFSLILVLESQILVILLNPHQKQALRMHQYSFSRSLVEVLYLQSTNSSPYLICATIQEVSLINLQKIKLPESPAHLLSVNFGITNLYAIEAQRTLNIFLYKLHVIQHHTIKNNQVLPKKRFQLNRNIKTLIFHENCLFVFYQSNDCMDIFRAKEEGIEKMWTYYWVQPNVRNIYPIGDSIFLKSPNYIKQIRLRNGLAKEQMREL